jgi:hypothetical protein
MARIDNLGGGELARLLARVSALENASPLANSSVERGQLRMYSGSSLLIQDGNLSVTGTATIAGLLNGSGTVTWTGPSNWNGPTNIGGSCTITGTLTVNSTTTLNGAVTLNNDLTLGTGKIVAGVITIDKTGTVGGRIGSTGALLLGAGAGYNVQVSPRLVVAGDEVVTGDQTVYGVKSFRMDHPTKPGWWIQHASTESPISGTEYTGTGTFNANGECVVSLPDYFESLNKLRNRTVQITAIGQPFMVGTDRVSGGKFTAYGQAGREFDWLVKAERFGGDFEAESEKPASV